VYATHLPTIIHDNGIIVIIVARSLRIILLKMKEITQTKVVKITSNKWRRKYLCAIVSFCTVHLICILAPKELF